MQNQNAKVKNNFMMHLWKKYCTFWKILLVIVGIFIIGLLIFLIFAYQEVQLIKGAVYEIAEGKSTSDIAKDLREKDIIPHPFFFKLYIRLRGLDTKLQAGRYAFPKERMSFIEFIDFLTSEALPKEVWFTVPEGYTVEQIAELLEVKGLVAKEEFVNITQYGTSKYAFVNVDTHGFDIADELFPLRSNFYIRGVRVAIPFETMEGFLFPDTYRVYADVTSDEIVVMMLKNFEQKIKPLLDEMEQQGKTMERVIVLASILEREVKTEEDMRLVSDILWRRLRAGVKLEVDSTLNYILPKEERREALTILQLAIDSPYNTYKYAGLPPTPIGNPGLKAITAAVNPQPNEYWYYLSTAEGEIVYAKTFEEQVKNKRKYLKLF